MASVGLVAAAGTVVSPVLRGTRDSPASQDTQGIRVWMELLLPRVIRDSVGSQGTRALVPRQAIAATVGHLGTLVIQDRESVVLVGSRAQGSVGIVGIQDWMESRPPLGTQVILESLAIQVTQGQESAGIRVIAERDYRGSLVFPVRLGIRGLVENPVIRDTQVPRESVATRGSQESRVTVVSHPRQDIQALVASVVLVGLGVAGPEQ